MTTEKAQKQIKILYVEDEAGTRDQITRLLAGQGYDTLYAANGKEGLELFQTHHPDIVITDIMMPFMNGLDMAREIRAQDNTTQIIVTTAFNDTDYLLAAIEIGINQFVTKPISLQKLFDSVNRCADIVRMHLKLQAQYDHIRMLSNALELSPSIVVITDSQGAIEYVNRKFCTLTGFSPEEAIGQTPRLISSGETPQEVYSSLWSTIRSGKEWSGILKNRKKNGELFWEYTSISPLTTPDGVPFKFIKTGEDITLRKQLEEETSRTRNIESVGILAGGLAHDFNNLLQVILGYVSLAKLQAEPGTPVHQMLVTAELSSVKARELSMRLMSLAKSSENINPSVALAPLLTDTINAICSNSGIVPHYSIAFDLPMLPLDVSQMQKVFNHLTTNALEAMPDGGSLDVTVTTATIDTDTALLLPPGRYVHVTISDTGSGIDAETLPKIFDPYFTTKPMGSQKGMGLGLTLCHSIVRKHKGTIFAESQAGHGTTIHVYLPVEPASGDTSPPPASP